MSSDKMAINFLLNPKKIPPCKSVKKPSSKKRGFQCETCGLRLKARRDIKNHVTAVHLKLKLFACPHKGCESSFGQESNLKRHVRSVHEEKKPFICKKCGLRSAAKRDIEKHVRAVHLKLRSFACPHKGCKSSFGKNNDLTRHMQIHDPNRCPKKYPHQCEKCGARFGEKRNRDKHMQNVHMVEKTLA